MRENDIRRLRPYQNLLLCLVQETTDIHHGLGVLVGSFTTFPGRSEEVGVSGRRILPCTGDRRHPTLQRETNRLTGHIPEGGVQYPIKEIQLPAFPAVDGTFGEPRRMRGGHYGYGDKEELGGLRIVQEECKAGPHQSRGSNFCYEFLLELSPRVQAAVMFHPNGTSPKKPERESERRNRRTQTSRR